MRGYGPQTCCCCPQTCPLERLIRFRWSEANFGAALVAQLELIRKCCALFFHNEANLPCDLRRSAFALRKGSAGRGTEHLPLLFSGTRLEVQREAVIRLLHGIRRRPAALLWITEMHKVHGVTLCAASELGRQVVLETAHVLNGINGASLDNRQHFPTRRNPFAAGLANECSVLSAPFLRMATSLSSEVSIPPPVKDYNGSRFTTASQR